MIYLLAILLLILFWLMWVFLPDRRERWRYGFDPSAAGDASTADDMQADESTHESVATESLQAYVAPETPGIAYTTNVAVASPPAEPTSSKVPESALSTPGAASPQPSVEESDRGQVPDQASQDTRDSAAVVDTTPTQEGTVAPVGADDLTRIKGVGSVLQSKLHSLGVHSFLQIAQFTAEDIARVDEVLNFKGRIEREQWVEQAKSLVAEI